MKKYILSKQLLFMFIISLVILNKAISQIKRAPAYPLITHNTYFSIWSFTDDLNASTSRHWSGANQALNGLIKVDDTTYNFLGNTALSPYKTILPASDESDYSCHYVFNEPSEGWEEFNFNDDNWNTGEAPFGNDSSKAKTLWTTPDIWVRRNFTIDDTNVDKLMLKLYHDDNVQVYLNGIQVYSNIGWNNDFEYFPIKNYLIKGNNVLAIHCHNSKFGAGLDFGLSDKVEPDSSQAIIPAIQKSVVVAATQTKYVFTCGKANLNLIFNSPLLISSLDIYSRPVTYITFNVSSNDNSKHDIKIYLGASSDIARTNTSEVVSTAKYKACNLSILKAGTAEQPILQKATELINWGYMYVAVPNIFNNTQYISQSSSSVNPFYDKDTLSLIKQGKVQVLGTILPFGFVGSKAEEKFIEIGYDDLYSVQFFHKNLQPWWKIKGQTIEEVLAISAVEYKAITQQCNAFDNKLYSDAKKAGNGSNYANLCAVAYRQSIAAHQLVKSPLSNDLLFLSKENSSGGYMATVDVSYPAFPLYLMYNPELVKGMLNGIFYYCESGRWKKEFAPHDLGSYPFGNGQTYWFDMPLEESGNMILMAAAVARAEKNTDYVKQHWAILTQWVNYIVETGWNPPTQLTSDDFAGLIAHSVNLSAKSINAIGAYAAMAGIMGDTVTSLKYYTIAKRWANNWLESADAGDHYKLAFDQSDTTWSQKYNLIWDKLLGLHLFPASAYDKEVAFYLTKQNKYGLPLDNRETYTKSDWLLWSSTLASNEINFKSLSDAEYRYVMQTHSRVPLSDHHWTITADKYQFQARSVIGGYFIKMLQEKWQSDSSSFKINNLFTNRIVVRIIGNNPTVNNNH